MPEEKLFFTELNPGEAKFMELWRTKKYAKITVRKNHNNEIYLVTTTENINVADNEKVRPSDLIPKTGYHDVNFKVVNGVIKFIERISKFRIDGVEPQPPAKAKKSNKIS